MSKEVLIEGEVVSGRKLGTKLGFPTINILYKGNIAGVFVGEILIKDEWMKAVIHIGKKLTIQDDEVGLEVHILNWEGVVEKGEEVVVKLFEKIRDTKKFENLEELKKEISKDVQFAKNWYNLREDIIKIK